RGVRVDAEVAQAPLSQVAGEIGGPGGVVAGRVAIGRDVVRLLDQEPAARRQGGDQPVQQRARLGHAGQQRPGVDEVERRRGQGDGGDVEAGDVEVGGADAAHEAGVDV